MGFKNEENIVQQSHGFVKTVHIYLFFVDENMIMILNIYLQLAFFWQMTAGSVSSLTKKACNFRIYH